MKVARPKQDALRAKAVVLAEQVKELKADRLTNTPKRQKQAKSAWIKGEHLDRVRLALTILADAFEKGTLTTTLAGMVKAQVGELTGQLTAMLRTRLDFSGGYHCIHDTYEFVDQTPHAVELRRFMEAAKDDDFKRREEEAARVRKIRNMEDRLRFSPIPGFFPTPEPVARALSALLGIRPDHAILEPSAGFGTLLEGCGVAAGDNVHVCEIHSSLRDVLQAKGFLIVGHDFLSVPERRMYDRVIMNPPFENGQEIEHIRHAYEFLRPGGRLGSVVSAGTFFRSHKNAVDFRSWLMVVGATYADLPAGSFASSFSPTGISARLVIIERK